MKTDDCTSELVQRERRGQLSSSERLALDVHVRSCESCRLTRLIGHDFDHFSAVDSADGERLEVMMQASERWVGKPRRLAKPPMTRWLLAAMATTLAAAATTIAVTGLRRYHPPPAEGTTASVAVATARTLREVPVSPASAPTGATEAANTIVVTDPANSRAESASTPITARFPTLERAVGGAVATALSAEQLLQKANLARRNGDSKEAIRLFHRLQREYGGSREAGLSFVALGTLLLERSQPVPALEQFNRYLALGAAALTAEALYGKGRTLAQLGVADQEQQTWRRLLTEFPKSPYATHAKRRLTVVK